MPRRSATSRAAAQEGKRPHATMASQPSAAAMSTSYCLATISVAWPEISSARLSGDADALRRIISFTHSRPGAKAGTSGKPARAHSAANSSSPGTLTRTSAPSACSRSPPPARRRRASRRSTTKSAFKNSLSQKFGSRAAYIRHGGGLAASPGCATSIFWEGSISLLSPKSRGFSKFPTGAREVAAIRRSR